MKKIISILLTLVLILTALTALVSCGGGGAAMSDEAESQMRSINAMFDSLVPTQSVTTTTQKIGALELTSVATLTVGAVDGNAAATYINEYEELAPLDGSNNANLILKKTDKLWYVEGKGLCKNGNGKWIADGEDFRPKAGDIKLTLAKSMFLTAEYDAETETFTATMDKTNANALLADFLAEDQKIASGLTLTITTAGGRISMLKLEYTEPEHDVLISEEDADEEEYVAIPEALVTIEVRYSYDAKVITLN